MVFHSFVFNVIFVCFYKNDTGRVASVICIFVVLVTVLFIVDKWTPFDNHLFT